MFYRIAILDDDADALRRMEEMFSAYGAAHPEHDWETACFTHAEPFMESVCRTGHEGEWAFDMLLMDIYLPDGNGMECARTLRRNGYDGMIIFQSSSAEHAVEAYAVDAVQYLIKPVSQERLFAAADRAVEELPRYRKKRCKKVTEEQPVQPTGNTNLEKKQTFRFFIDTLWTKWNSRRNG